MVRLAFYIHNHQPVGNFDHVFQHAYEHSYLPLIKTLLRYPNVKFGIHNSGPLCDWLLKNHPEYFDHLKMAIENGQAEILASAYSEPILSLIPPNDVVEQIKYFKDYLYKLLGVEATGLWLTERVWEPGLIPLLAEAGIEYTLLDDTHFLYAGLSADELKSYFLTEDNGKILKIFPISMKLRYLIPFHPVEEVRNYLLEISNLEPGAIKVLGDDGEKFGVWPGTYNWVYRESWLERFLEFLSTNEFIKTVHLRDIIKKEPPAGRIYIPTASYEEMGEWVLPLEAGRNYLELKRNVESKYYHLIHGGYFKNFLSRYPEANLMHKRMLYVSKNLQPDISAKLSLWRGQCSCAYWHGIFGGLYLPHLREAVYRNLIEAELHSIKTGIEKFDFDIDGRDELVISTPNLFCVMRLNTGSFIEIDVRDRRQNILNYLARRVEKYHDLIPQSSSGEEEVRSIHEVIRTKGKDLDKYLIYDKYERGFGFEHLLASLPQKDDFYQQRIMGKIIEYQLLDYKPFEFIFKNKELNFKKKIVIDPASSMLEFTYEGHIGNIGLEFSLGIFNPGLKINGQASLYQLQELDDLNYFQIEGTEFKPIKFSASEKFKLLSYPIETISSSESGFEKIFQGFALLLIFYRNPSIRIEL
ncbi:MAG: alpha-amylase/4-alpha-glucanotransferase domain-containing protein [candidate division WOR-3 bacterium]